MRWLENTSNLLNVALTRARVGLIIIGDFAFCSHSLEARSIYNRLARHVEQHGRVLASPEEILALNRGKIDIVGTLLDPTRPEFNRTNLIEFVASCDEFVYWMDPYFDNGITVLWDELFQREPAPSIRTIRLLTADRQLVSSEGARPPLKVSSVERVKVRLASRGVDFAFRVLTAQELPHDRFLYHKDGAINMPPFAGAYGKHRRVSEYTPSKTTTQDFARYWERAQPIGSGG